MGLKTQSRLSFVKIFQRLFELAIFVFLIYTFYVVRLWRLVNLSMEQQRTVEALWTSDGVCACGAPIARMADKICLAQVNSSWCALETVRNTLAVGIYCASCADKINVLLKSLKALPEADKLKRQTFSDHG